MGDQLTHLDGSGQARMVDVSDKPPTRREAVARGSIKMQRETLELIQAGQAKKGDVLGTARIAGIMGAKRTSELIPLCHPIPLSYVSVELQIDEEASQVNIEARVATTAQTGVEMEALTAVSVAALTIYDMAKSVDRTMEIGNIKLVRKSGGIHGDYVLKDTR